MARKKINARVIKVEELIEGAEKADLFEKVTNKIIREERNKLISNSTIKRGEDWSALSNQVVGAENL